MSHADRAFTYNWALRTMIIYGKKSTMLVRHSIPEDCSSCGAENSMDITLYQKYSYLLGIPFLPTKIMPMTECSNCRQVLEKSEFTPALDQHYKIIKKEIKFPLWTLSGFILFICMLVLCIVLSI